MKKALTAGGIAALLALTAVAFTAPDHRTRTAEETTRADALRITAHLRTVESELLARDLPGLSVEQRARVQETLRSCESTAQLASTRTITITPPAGVRIFVMSTVRFAPWLT